MTGPQRIASAQAMVAKAFENAVRPDVPRIAESAGVPRQVVVQLVDAERARRAPAGGMSAKARAMLLLRKAGELEALARLLRGMALGDPEASDLICIECDEVFADPAGATRHRTRKHTQPQEARA